MKSNSILLGDLQDIHHVIRVHRKRFEGGTVLVTGCAGFLGYQFMNYLVRYAEELGIHKVIGLDSFLLERPRWLDDLCTEFPETLMLRAFDISRDSLESIHEAANARFVLHMASIASPTFYRQYPLETIDANIWGLRRLLDYYKDAKSLEGLLFFSSSEIYGDPDSAHIPTREDYRGNVSCVGPRACYDESKRFGETLCQVFSEAHGVPITVARPFNNYGPGMRLGDKRLPADLAGFIVRQQNIILYSDGSPMRTFCYISDALSGYLLCLLHGQFDAFNIGIDVPEVSVAKLAEIFVNAGRDILGYRGEVRYEVSDDKHYLSHNPQRRCPVIAKAREFLGYDPKILVDEGVHRYLQFLAEDSAMQTGT